MLRGATPATLLGIHIILSEWSIVSTLANEEEILPQDECKLVALILTLHQYPQKYWDSLLWQDANDSPQPTGSSRRAWVESLSMKEMESWTRCRQKTFGSASEYVSKHKRYPSSLRANCSVCAHTRVGTVLLSARDIFMKCWTTR